MNTRNSALVALIISLSLPHITHAWTVNIDCEEGTPNTDVTQSSADNNFSDAAGDTQYSDQVNVGGNQSCKMAVNEGDSGFGYWGGRKVLPEKLEKGDEVWARVHVYFPIGFDYNSSSAGNKLKFLRFHTRSSSEPSSSGCDAGNEGYHDVLILPLGLSNDSPGSSNNYVYGKECDWRWFYFGTWENNKIKHGRWETYELYIKFDNIAQSDGGEGIVRVWKDEELLLEVPNIETLETASSYSDTFLLFTYWNGGSPKTQHLYIDDLIVTNELPPNTDSSGNPRIGQGEAASLSPPSAIIDATVEVN